MPWMQNICFNRALRQWKGRRQLFVLLSLSGSLRSVASVLWSAQTFYLSTNIFDQRDIPPSLSSFDLRWFPGAHGRQGQDRQGGHLLQGLKCNLEGTVSEPSVSKHTVSWSKDRYIRDMYTLGTLQRHVLRDLLSSSAKKQTIYHMLETAMLVPSAAISGWLIWG